MLNTNPHNSRRRILFSAAWLTCIQTLPKDQIAQQQSSKMQGPDEVDQPQDPPADEPAETASGMPTLGGRLFWGDVCFRRGYRIQQNVFTHHFRLLDPEDRRCASGTLTECRDALERITQDRRLPLDTGHVVLCIHGIGRSSKSMTPVIQALKNEPVTAVPFDYPSNRSSLAECADYLRHVVDSLSAAEHISFVVHSMGGLVVRRYLQDNSCPRHHRLVMLGTPNQGAELASMLKGLSLFRAIYGPAGQELAAGENSVAAALPIPTFPFGIIAGGRGADRGYNPLLKGDNDGTVTVASTRLPGAADFLRISRLHSFLMSAPEVQTAVRNFLNHARFSTTNPPQPISVEQE
jgi:pimeloyl-ACP methyl ester carboxylesterase